jgi:hypothetical protein
MNDAKQRVVACAPRRQPMYVAFGAASPAAAPVATPNDALNRVQTAASEVNRWLKRLLNDMSAPTSALVDVQNFSGSTGGRASIPMEPHLIASAVDPDLGHWLGFGDVDTGSIDPPMPEGAVVV